MFTVCPKCTLTLAVTAADLRAGQGYVRCGRCANVFNALLALSEDSPPTAPHEAPRNPPAALPSPAPPGHSAPATPPRNLNELQARPEPAPPAAPPPPQAASRSSMPPAAAPPAAAPAAAPAVVPATPATAAAASAPAAPAARAAASTPAPAAASGIASGSTTSPGAAVPPALRLVDSPPRPSVSAPIPAPATLNPATGDDWDIDKYQGTGTYETIVLEGDTFLQTEELIPEEALDSEIASVSRRIAAAQGAADLAVTAGEGAPPQRSASAPSPAPLMASVELRSAMQQVNQQLLQPDPQRAAARLGPEPRTRPGVLAVLGAVALGLLLLIQAVNHWRNDLATRTAWYGPLSRWSALLGEPLQPNWDLGAYDVHQLGASADSADSRSLRVRLSLANRSERPQGLPLLRLTLLDRYGKALSAGELAPAQYLPASLRGERLMTREQRIDTEIAVLDPTQQASSFELDVCVATAAGVRCAGDNTSGAGAP